MQIIHQTTKSTSQNKSHWFPPAIIIYKVYLIDQKEKKRLLQTLKGRFKNNSFSCYISGIKYV